MEQSLNTELRLNQRNAEFFLTFDAEREKQSREFFSVSLRKKNREKYYSKKRASFVDDNIPIPLLIKNQLPDENFSLEEKLKQYLHILSMHDNDLPIKIYCISACRKLFEKKKNSAIYTSLGFIDIIIGYLKLNEVQLSIQCTWLLLNISSGNNSVSNFMKEKHVIVILLWLIYQKIPQITENCLWCLANLTCENKEISQYILGLNFFDNFFLFLQDEKFKDNIHAYWLLAHICKYEENVQIITTIMHIFVNKIFFSNKDIINPCLSGIAIMTVNRAELVDLLLRFDNILSRIIELTYDNDCSISFKAMKIIGNISFTSEENTGKLLKYNILDSIGNNFNSNSNKVRKEAYYALSNLLISPKEQIIQILSNDKLWKNALEGIIDSYFDVRAEAWEVFNLISSETDPNTFKFVEELVIYMNTSLNKETDPQILKLILKTYKNILNNSGIRIEYFKKLFEDSSCFDELAKKKNHGNTEVVELVTEIINTFYDFEELHGIKNNSENEVESFSFS